MDMQYSIDNYGMPEPIMGGPSNGMGPGDYGPPPVPVPHDMYGADMPPRMDGPPTSGPYLDQLIYERQSIDAVMFPSACTLLDTEIERLRSEATSGPQRFPEPMFVDIMNKKMKLVQKISMPNDLYPQLNFGGHIIGKSGENIKKIASETNCRVMIFGRGSINNRQKEEQLLNSGDPKYSHLCQQLHVHCETLALPSDAYYNMSMAITAVKKHFDEVIEDSGAQPQQRGGGRGGPRGFGGGRGMGAPGGRGFGGGRGFRGGGGDRGGMRGGGPPRGGRGGDRGGFRGRGGFGDRGHGQMMGGPMRGPPAFDQQGGGPGMNGGGGNYGGPAGGGRFAPY